jgi:hypothetical protein
MAKHKPKKAEPDPESAATFHDDLAGFDIKVNTFGEMESTIDMDKLNAFLNRKIKDKKLKGQDNEPGQEK